MYLLVYISTLKFRVILDLAKDVLCPTGCSLKGYHLTLVSC